VFDPSSNCEASSALKATIADCLAFRLMSKPRLGLWWSDELTGAYLSTPTDLACWGRFFKRLRA